MGAHRGGGGRNGALRRARSNLPVDGSPPARGGRCSPSGASPRRAGSRLEGPPGGAPTGPPPPRSAHHPHRHRFRGRVAGLGHAPSGRRCPSIGWARGSHVDPARLAPVRSSARGCLLGLGPRQPGPAVRGRSAAAVGAIEEAHPPARPAGNAPCPRARRAVLGPGQDHSRTAAARQRTFPGTRLTEHAGAKGEGSNGPCGGGPRVALPPVQQGAGKRIRHRTGSPSS